MQSSLPSVTEALRPLKALLNNLAADSAKTKRELEDLREKYKEIVSYVSEHGEQTRVVNKSRKASKYRQSLVNISRRGDTHTTRQAMSSESSDTNDDYILAPEKPYESDSSVWDLEQRVWIKERMGSRSWGTKISGRGVKRELSPEDESQKKKVKN